VLEDHLNGELLAPVSALCREGRIEPDVMAAACIRLFHVNCVGTEGTVCGLSSWCRVRHLSPQLP